MMVGSRDCNHNWMKEFNFGKNSGRKTDKKSGRLLDLSGQRYGKLTVLYYVPGTPAKWECRCDCGNTKVVATHNLRTGHTKSCGCLPRGRKKEA